MPAIKPRQGIRYLSSNESYLSSVGENFKGINLDDDHDTIPSGFFRSLVNFDLYKSDMRTRRGIEVTNAAYNYPGDVTNLVVWDIGDDDIAIFCQEDEGTTRFFYKNLTTLGDFDKIYIKGTGSGEQLELNIDETPDMFVLNNRVYAFTTSGNYAIEYNVGETNLFTTRTLGLYTPSITSFSINGGGTMNGTYVFAVELVYQRNGIDAVASSPNRVQSNTTEFISGTFSNEKITLTVDSASLPSGGGGDDYWTHVRIYQSRRLDRDTSDPANPIGPFGTDFQLYPTTLVDRSILEGASYQVVIDIDDSAMDLTEVWEIDRIELSPLPPAYVGAVHKNRIYVSGAPFYSTENESILFYSNFAGTKYSEQTNALQNIPVSAGDGKKIRKLLSLNNDLVIFKETATYICQNGNVDLPPVPIDKSIGVSNHRLAKWIPQLGLVAFTSDNFDIKIFNETLHWTNIYGSLEISRQVRSKARAYAAYPNQVSMIYSNGKLMICNGGGTPYDNSTEVLVLHVEQGKGWTTYDYNLSAGQAMYTFDNNSRAGIITGNGQVAFEIELYNTFIDYPTVNDGTSIPVSLDTWMFQSNQGQDLLEYQKIIVGASLDETDITGTMYVNEIPWLSVSNTAFKPSPGELTAQQRSGMFQLYVSKKPIFPLMYLHLATAGDVRINLIKWVGIITKDMPLNYLNRISSGAAPTIATQPPDTTVILP